MSYNENLEKLILNRGKHASRDPAGILAELQGIEADPVFARSSVSAHLLQYLVGETVAGRGASLKSYTVAVEGLGKGADHEPQVDASARVAVGRLRKALDAFYSGPGRQRRRRILIPAGSYDVVLAENEFAPAPDKPAAEVATHEGPKARRRLLVGGAVAAVLVLLLAAISWRAVQIGRAEALEHWKNSDFPTIAVRHSGRTKRLSNGYDSERMVKLTLAELSEFPSVRAVSDQTGEPAYILDLYASDDDGGSDLTANLINNSDQKIIWNKKYDTKDLNSEEIISKKLSYRIASISGIINQDISKSISSYDSPNRCWLRFSHKIQYNFVTNDPALNDCARDWYSANSSHPLAAGVYGWTLVDQSIVDPIEIGRKRKLQRAMEVLEEAERIFPDSGFAALSLMRAYNFSDQPRRMRAVYARTLAMNANNFDFQGAIGTMLTLRNLPEGEPLIDVALANNPNSPAVYHFGKFIAAMMREDVDGAIREVRAAELSDRTMSLLPVMHAAMNAKVGRLDAAKDAWAEAGSTFPVLRTDPDLFFDRMPLSDDVVARFKAWLAPVL